MLEIQVKNLLQANAAVSGLVGSRIYPLVAPQESAYPRIVYQRVSTKAIQTLGGITNLNESLLQLTSWGDTYNSARSLADIVKTSIHGYLSTGSGIKSIRINNDMSNLNDPLVGGGSQKPAYQIAQDYFIWFD